LKLQQPFGHNPNQYNFPSSLHSFSIGPSVVPNERSLFPNELIECDVSPSIFSLSPPLSSNSECFSGSFGSGGFVSALYFCLRTYWIHAVLSHPLVLCSYLLIVSLFVSLSPLQPPNFSLSLSLSLSIILSVHPISSHYIQLHTTSTNNFTFSEPLIISFSLCLVYSLCIAKWCSLL
jgi:hypothetical protein